VLADPGRTLKPRVGDVKGSKLRYWRQGWTAKRLETDTRSCLRRSCARQPGAEDAGALDGPDSAAGKLNDPTVITVRAWLARLAATGGNRLPPVAHAVHATASARQAALTKLRGPGTLPIFA
jgi:hypothetical protein